MRAIKGMAELSSASAGAAPTAPRVGNGHTPGWAVTTAYWRRIWTDTWRRTRAGAGRSTKLGTWTWTTGSQAISCRTLIFAVAVSTLMLLFWRTWGEAHPAGCHRWHSCASDTGSYVCGDLGYCSQCPDNQYCQGGWLRPASQRAPEPSTPSTTQAETYLLKRVIDGDTL